MNHLLLAFVVPAFAAGLVPLEVRGPYVIAKVHLSGQGPFRFLIDTGAQSSVIQPRLAQRLGLRGNHAVQVDSAYGEAVVPAFTAPLACLGNHCVAGLEVLFYALDRLEAAAGPIDGVLGQNFLSRLNFLLDYANRRLQIEEVTSSGLTIGGTRVPVRLVNGRVLVSATLPGQDQTWQLALDSAASHLTLFASSNLRFPSGSRKARLDSSFGSAVVDMLRLPVLRIQDQLLHEVTAGLLSGVGEIRGEDGLLPTSLFRAVYFNHRDGYVILNPTWKPPT